jgi:hypothetical protein
MIEIIIMLTTTVICGNDGDSIDSGDNKADISGGDIYDDMM